MKYAVLSRDHTGQWVMTGDDGNTSTLPYTADKTAGYVAEQTARLNPDAQIGVRSREFGPNTVMSFGPVVWLKPGFEQG